MIIDFQFSFFSKYRKMKMTIGVYRKMKNENQWSIFFLFFFGLKTEMKLTGK